MISIRPALWIEALAWFSLAIAFASALIILVDIALFRRRQRMWVMNAVYPITALYWGPVALWFYLRHGRGAAQHHSGGHEMSPDHDAPSWRATAKSVSHCGAGCTLGDIAAEWLVYGTGLAIAGKALYADFALDFAFAWLFGIVFQYFAIAPPMHEGTRRQALAAAIKADTLSILAFQIGLFLGMWVYQDLIFSPGLAKTTAAYWMLMQVSMIIGFFTAWPVNVLLVRRGIKEKM